MLEIILVRHGETDWNRTMRIMGRKPVPLNATGRRQAKAMGIFLSDISIDDVYSSPVKRAVETARLIVQGRRLRVREDDALAEIHYGEWIGRTFDEVRGTKEFDSYWKNPSTAGAPGGENMQLVFERAIRFVENLRKSRSEGRILVVSHADVIKLMLVHYMGVGVDELHMLRVDNGSLSYLFFPKGRVRVLAVNCQPQAEMLFAATDRFKKEFSKPAKKKK